MSMFDSGFQDRFWRKVEKAEGCWIWRGARSSKQYGCIGHLRKVISAHRASWEIANGAIPPEMHVLHRCDNPPCVNPDHLFLGTHQDNMRDRDSKGRCRAGSGPGEQTPTHRLKADQVVKIRDLVSRGFAQNECARLFGVHKATVNDIVLRKTWAHL